MSLFASLSASSIGAVSILAVSNSDPSINGSLPIEFDPSTPITDQVVQRYHEGGKIAVRSTVPCRDQRDLSIVYSPHVAKPCVEIAADRSRWYDLTAAATTIGVITNGTAVLGLGNIGPWAATPVMEGKCILDICFAGVNTFPLMLDTEDPDKVIETVRIVQPSFGGINLEDIAAPHCFYIEEQLIKHLDIPVFHDDQHGTAIVSAAGLLNALEIQGKDVGNIRVVISGAGAAAIASAKLFLKIGVAADAITMLDRRGVIYEGRENTEPYRNQFARRTKDRELSDAIRGADVFVGLSGPNTLSAGMLSSMDKKPIVFAMANPDPEIAHDLAMQVAAQHGLSMVYATGRSDYPNQLNNVLGFPYIFRAAIDTRVRRINDEMKLAAAHALAKLAHEEVPEDLMTRHQRTDMHFGPRYIIPSPFDERLIVRLPQAIAEAAIVSGVARKKLVDMRAYRESLLSLQSELRMQG